MARRVEGQQCGLSEDERLVQLQAENAQLRAENAQLKAAIAQLQAELAALWEQVQELQRPSRLRLLRL